MTMEINPSLLAKSNLSILPKSMIQHDGCEYAAAATEDGLKLVVVPLSPGVEIMDFLGDKFQVQGCSGVLCKPTHSNIAALQARLPWLQPQLLGVKTSAGMGDRLGLATPGHVRAIQKTGGTIAPIFAQQSIREMARTGRTPQQVMDDAIWGVFQEGWRGGFGADADHLKTPEDIDHCLAAGFTFFTVDPGAYVNPAAETAGLAELKQMASKLPGDLQLDRNGLLNQSITLESTSIYFDETTLLKAMVKYGLAVWDVVWMYRHLQFSAGSRPFELEVSVDETDQPTSHAEHIYIASELKRLGVQWVSLAPRYVGRFEKGVDYLGDPAEFEKDITGHAAIARGLGPYKLSLHSGSDKFSIYPAAMRQTKGLVHLKTAGTSYLEALRTIAALNPSLFRDIYLFAREHYEIDRASYHVSAQLECAPMPENEMDLPDLLEQFDAREILHVTFGSVLKERTPGGNFLFYDRIMAILTSHPDAYAANLERHFIRHLEPFLS
ncbi:MAG TPA: tagaturonate epimerase family protein [Anaerolineaceae bacterium]|nr:tagaturonate epimerase family protein [Anaerolineaceae bacterium]